MKRRLSLALFILISLQCFAQTPGNPDPAWGINGKLLENYGFSSFEITAGKVQPDGKIIIGGWTVAGNANTPTADFFLVRFLPDGTIDNSFGNNGIVYTDISALSSDVLVKIELLPDGRIVAGGMSNEPNSYYPFVSLARYMPDGKPDSSFSDDGVYFGKFLLYAYVTDMQVHPNGKILVAARDGSWDMQLLVFNSDGSPDNTFSLQQVNPNVVFKTQGVAWLPDGKILAAGYGSPDGNSTGAYIFLARFFPDGAIDSSFAIDGLRQITHDAHLAGMVNMRLSPDSTQVYLSLLHSVTPYDTSRVVMMRFDTDGNADSSFGVNGIRSLPTVTGNFVTEGNNRFVLQPDGKLLFTGITKNDFGVNQFSALRLLTDGNVDNSFGVNAILPGIASGTRHAPAVTLVQPDGKIITAGYELANGIHWLALTRNLSNGAVDNSFNGGNMRILAIGSSARHDEVGLDIRIQPDGKILAAGIAGNHLFSSAVVSKYYPDGKRDSAFGTHGLSYTSISPVPGQHTNYFSPFSRRHFLSMANDAQGNIFVLTTGTNLFQRRNALSLIKLKPDGSPDSSFSNFGRKDFNTSETQDDYPVGLVIQADGKPVVAAATWGNDPDLDSSYISLLRLKTDGSVDSSFGTAGVFRDILFTGNEDFFRNQPHRLAIQPDGKILLCGESKSPMFVRWALHRYTTNGAFDNQFNNSAVTVVPNSVNFPTAIALQPDGKILVAGITFTSGIIVVRYNELGNPDPGFGANGVKANIAQGTNYVTDLALQPDGKILVLGELYDEDITNDQSYIKVSRLLANGNKDENFGSFGDLTIAPSPVMQDVAGALAVQDNGRILVIGGATSGWEDFYIGKSDLVIYGLTNSLVDCSSFTVNAGRDTAICPFGSAVIGTPAAGGVSYTWSPATDLSSANVPQPTASPLTATTYIVSALNPSGCIARDTVQVNVLPQPLQPVITQNTNTISSSAATGNQWYRDGNIIPGATAQTYVVSVPGVYTVRVTVNGCVSNASAPLTVVTTGINSPELDRNIIIAPNPVEADLNVRYTGNFATFDIAVLDLSGKQVFAKAQFNYTFSLSMRKFSSGAYVVKIVNAKTGEQIHRLIMKK
jgi:uncharacterized delta-60 repeat protein